MTLFEQACEVMADGGYYTRRQLIEAIDCKPSRLGEMLQNAVRRGAIEQTQDEPMRFRLLDANRKGGIPYTEKPRPGAQFWVLPTVNEPRQWWQV